MAHLRLRTDLIGQIKWRPEKSLKNSLITWMQQNCRDLCQQSTKSWCLGFYRPKSQFSQKQEQIDQKHNQSQHFNTIEQSLSIGIESGLVYAPCYSCNHSISTLTDTQIQHQLLAGSYVIIRINCCLWTSIKFTIRPFYPCIFVTFFPTTKKLSLLPCTNINFKEIF